MHRHPPEHLPLVVVFDAAVPDWGNPRLCLTVAKEVMLLMKASLVPRARPRQPLSLWDPKRVGVGLRVMCLRSWARPAMIPGYLVSLQLMVSQQRESVAVWHHLLAHGSKDWDRVWHGCFLKSCDGLRRSREPRQTPGEVGLQPREGSE